MPVGLILGLLSGFIKLASAWVQRSRDRQLIEAGEAAAIARGLHNAQTAIKRAQDIRRGVAVMPRADVDNVLRPPERRE
jgi:hypothetical protein